MSCIFFVLFTIQIPIVYRLLTFVTIINIIVNMAFSTRHALTYLYIFVKFSSNHRYWWEKSQSFKNNSFEIFHFYSILKSTLPIAVTKNRIQFFIYAGLRNENHQLKLIRNKRLAEQYRFL